ncbi:DEAD/DEAH box helicase [Streptomyces acidiscabies]|uniref:RNA helicase n=1 Tax=Streptomyces acidiscabies TaxID=42234 RepID=A0A0L0K3P3_9ACTN|nr:DEAD/DEAH box helicase [Streptomyces acidiscabies]KND32210.1 DEAD/DEAH box helicase [Streptomyces acidiscabies]
MTLPVALSGTDIIGQAKTGTGKTLGFGLPLLERVTVPADVEAGRAAPEMLTDAPQALVVVPTRELCTQVTNDLLTAGKVRNVRVTAIYGGRAYEPQVEALRKGVDVVVGTPGRLLDLAGQKKLDLKHVRCLVLDEADEMLDLGFLPDVEKIMAMLPARRQTMLFSATMPGAVIGLARRYMSQPTHIRATSPDDEGATVANTAQYVYRAHSMDKPEMVSRILQAEGRALAMVFCRTKRTAADIAEQLERRGFASGAVHGDLGQGAREQALRAFRNGKVDVLVCTDVAARGIDVENVTHVINYQSPEDEKTYLHRIGRTGRAGASGTAITLVDWDDIPRWQLINKALDLGFNDPPETYSTSPHLFEDLKIPAGTKGVLPRSERLRAGLDAEELEDLGEPGGRSRGRGGRGDRDRRGGSGDRDRDRRGGRGESAPPVEAESERPSRTPRRRRRTRNGSPLEQGAAPVVQQQPAAVEETAPAGRTPRRRRRTRSGAQESAVTTPVTPSVEQAPAAEVAVETAEGQPRRRTRTRRGDEQPVASVVESESAAGTTPVAAEVAVETAEGAPRRRTRTRKESTPVAAPEVTAAAVVETVEAKPRRTRKAAAEAVVEAVAAEVVETKPRRTRKAAAAPVEAAEAVVDVVEAKPRRTRKTAEVAPVAEAPVEAAPRRTRKTAATKAAEAAVDTAEAVEAKPRRTRKTAVAVEAPEGEAVEAKPRRTRKTAATKAAEAVVEAAEAVVEAVAAKPRRTRKTAAAEAAPVAEAPAEAAPRRTRKTAAAKAAEAAVDTAEAVETKPRRTRKTAATKAAEAAVETAEAVVEAKPRRTRKTAATKAAEAAVDTAEAVETKPRRTRKTAAPSEAPVEAVEEAKPRRRTTRKAATAAEIPAQATEEPVVKPRRTRKAAAVEPTDG